MPPDRPFELKAHYLADCSGWYVRCKQTLNVQQMCCSTDVSRLTGAVGSVKLP